MWGTIESKCLLDEAATRRTREPPQHELFCTITPLFHEAVILPKFREDTSA